MIVSEVGLIEFVLNFKWPCLHMIINYAVFAGKTTQISKYATIKFFSLVYLSIKGEAEVCLYHKIIQRYLIKCKLKPDMPVYYVLCFKCVRMEFESIGHKIHRKELMHICLYT